MSDYADDQAIVIWGLGEPMEGLSRDLIWGLGVRSRSDRQLDFLLDTLKEKGSCKVIITDPKGNDCQISCCLADRAVAV